MRGKKQLLRSLPELTERELVLVWRDVRRTADIVAIGGGEREWNNYIEVKHAIERECEKRFGEKPDDYSNREGGEELPAIYKKIFKKKRGEVMDETQRLIIEACGAIRLEIHINWKTIESSFVVSHFKHEEVFANIRDAKETFDLLIEKESEK